MIAMPMGGAEEHQPRHAAESAAAAIPRPIGVAVVGCGYWGPHHVRIFESFVECCVVAVDSDEAIRRRLRHQFPRLDVRSSIESILGDSTIDAVVIATPTVTHGDLTRQALLAGKHVLCEKPLCPRAAEAHELTALADDRDLTLMTGYTFLFNPGIVRIRELVAQGELGELLTLSSVRTNLGPIRRDVNAALDLAAHDVAVFNWLLGSEPALVSALGGAFVRPGVEDVVFVSLRYPSGCVANIHASWLNPKKVRQLTVVGQQRMVTWDDLAWATPVAIYDCGAAAEPGNESFGEFQRVSMWTGDVRLPKIEPSEPLKSQARCFLDAIQGAPLDRASGEFTVGTIRVLEAIGDSLASHGHPVRIAPSSPTRRLRTKRESVSA